mmetsp:Transcript_8467/g.23997  ORF Transcript_8467/g.23997 Transcript_8467/m.23997 type:complete len:220 (+) Transcript_8467:91-750(+)
MSGVDLLASLRARVPCGSHIVVGHSISAGFHTVTALPAPACVAVEHLAHLADSIGHRAALVASVVRTAVVEQVAAVPLVNARPETDGSIGVAVEVSHHLPGKPDGVPVIGVQHDRRTTVPALGRGQGLGRAVPGVMSVLRRPVDERIVRHQRALKQMARRHGRDRRRRAHAAVEHLNVRRVQGARVDIDLVQRRAQGITVHLAHSERHPAPLFYLRVEA